MLKIINSGITIKSFLNKIFIIHWLPIVRLSLFSVGEHQESKAMELILESEFVIFYER